MSKNTPLSLEFDRKKSKRLLRQWRAGDRLELLTKFHPRYRKAPKVLQDLKLRDAQLVVAREYGFENWQALLSHLKSDLDPRLLKAYEAAQVAIKEKDSDALDLLLETHDDLLGLEHPEHGLLIECTQSYANYVADEEEFWTSHGCAGLLLERGSAVPQATVMRALTTGSRKMVELFRLNEKILPCLRVVALTSSLGELRFCLGDEKHWLPESLAGEDGWPIQDRGLILADAFFYACRHFLKDQAELLLEKAREFELGLESLEVEQFMEAPQELHLNGGHTILQQSHLLGLKKALLEDDGPGFEKLLSGNRWLLEEAQLDWQRASLEECGFRGCAAVAKVLLSSEPRLVKEPKPRNRALNLAVDYGQAELVEILGEHWKLEDELPWLAGLGELEKVKACFDSEGNLRQGSLVITLGDERRAEDSSTVLKQAFGLACMNQQIEVLDFLLEMGVDIDSAWGLHEPSSFLHEAAGHGKLETVKYLVERGADIGLKDERYECTAAEWAEFMGCSVVLEFLRGVG